jgi:tetratricopeptide (TPR) repeat protein
VIKSLIQHRSLRLAISLLAIAGCLWLIWTTGKLSVGRILSRFAMGARNLPAANESLRFAYSDADSHFARAKLLKDSGFLDESLREFERAASLRPRDYYLWLELGIAREDAGDSEGALAAFNEAVRLAPYYGQPRWQRGNVFARQQRYDEAFTDLRAAAESNPNYLPNLIDLSWGFSQGDLQLAEQLGDFTTPGKHVAFARYLARQGLGQQALVQIQAAGGVENRVKDELVQQLISKGAFAEAFQLWRGTDAKLPEIYDGGFEAPLSFDESGFGWRVQRDVPGTTLSLDSNGAHSGSRALRVEFNGNSSPETPIVSQWVMVEPNQTYRVSFAVRTQEVVTGGLPLLRVAEVSANRRVLGQSSSFPQGTGEWRVVDLAFATGASTRVVTISVQRERCTTEPCPAFGTIWLDSFGIRLVPAHAEQKMLPIGE